MIISCPSCEAGYQIEPSTLGVNGRDVRCARCQMTWFAAPDPDARPSEGSAEPEFTPPATRARGEHSAAPWHDPLAEYVPAHDPVLGPLAERPEPVAADAPPLVPAIEHVPAPAPGEAPLILNANGEIKTASKPRRMRKPRKWPRPGLRAATVILIALTGALVLARTDAVRLAPQTASLYAAIGLPVNLRGLAFENVTSVKEQHDGVTVLVVEGTIVSASGSAVEVPPLRLALRGDAGNEVYAWTAAPTRSILAPGETVPFRTRLASPPPDGRDVVVRFAHWRDGDVGGR